MEDPIGIDEIRTEGDLESWFASVDGRISEHATDWPACWGEQMRFNDFGEYVDMDRVRDVLKTPRELSLYYCMCANSQWPSKYPAVEIAAHVADEAWLDKTSAAYNLEDDCACFCTECLFPEDEYSHKELVELYGERPDLFGDEDMAEYPELALAARDAGATVAIGGEPTWYCGEEGFRGLHTESELRAYFAAEPDLADDRAAGSSWSDWVLDQERVGNLVPLFGFERGGLVRDAVDGLAVDVVVGLPWYDETCAGWRQGVVDQDGYRYEPLCSNLRAAAGPDRAPAKLAEQARLAARREAELEPRANVARQSAKR